MPISQVLTGWIQKDIALRFTPKGKQLLEFSISLPAGNENNEDGTTKKVYTYVRCTIWGDEAEVASENYSEGELVEVKGWIRAGKPYTTKNTNELRSTIVMTVFDIAHVK